ncbi:MAG: PQQ-binding-like beta-propeller repeat protein [Candidatus Krumholzibacteriota bacterium]|nr:PQQ-binding-like beta-propeller repeat protein [Candidatus Krumholzibacteriota bacterium]
MRRNNKNILNIIVGVALCAAPVALLAPSASGQCEYPLPVRSNNPKGNVVWLVGASTSMNEIVYHVNYNLDSTYVGIFDDAATYSIKSDGNYSPKDVIKGNYPITPLRYLIKSDSEAGRYAGNYLNWLYYHATAAEIASMPLVTRIQSAKAVLSDVVVGQNNIRFGVWKTKANGDGGSSQAKLGSPRTDILNQANGISARGDGAMAETMMEISDLFEKKEGDLSCTVDTNGVEVCKVLTAKFVPFQAECQQSFIVILTDGYPTEDLNVPAALGDWDGDGREPGDCASIGAPFPNSANCSDWMDDAAGYMFTHDHRPDLDGLQNIVTYVVGYYIDAPLLQETADNGDGFFISARTVDELHAALSKVLADIVERISAGAAITIVSTEDQTNSRLFRTKYLPVKWHGFVEAYSLPYASGDTPLWEAGSLLATRSPMTRDIWTSVGNFAYPFTVGYSATLYPSMGLPDATAAGEVIAWTRGEDVAGYRDREGWPLGDVVHSSPTFVGPPSGFSLDPDYALFHLANAARREMVYVGANDGMLHALDAETGDEVWAYIPEASLPNLASHADTSYCHEYEVDLTPMVSDQKIGGNWMTVLVAGMREGGDAYFALDVSDPDMPNFLWETSIPGLNGSWSKPAFAKVPWSSEPIMIVGTGMNMTNREAAVIMLDMSDGSIVWADTVSVPKAKPFLDDPPNMMTSAELLDLNLDGVTDLAYMGDLLGNMHRIDLSVFPPTSTILFAAGLEQPIQSKPILTVDYNNDVFVYFGTGRYLDTPDFGVVDQQTFYCVYDDHSTPVKPLDPGDLVDQTLVISPVGTADDGWMVNLVQQPGERIVTRAVIVAEVVYVTSIAPNAVMCNFGGHSWLYSFKFRNGAAYDDDDDDSNDTTADILDLGDGISSEPVVDIANEEVIVQDSDTELHISDAKGDIVLLIVRSWRQRYN